MNPQHHPRRRRGKATAKSSPAKRIQIELGKRIRELRKEQGLSQGDLARACQLWPAHIGEIERGNHNLRLSSLVKITKNLGTTIERMLKGIM